MTSTRLSPAAVLLSPVWGLAAMQGAITLMWVIYNLYLPDFLVQFGFPLEAATALLVVENLLAAGSEPVMGNFSDRAQRWVGTRFPFIMIGVILSSALFLSIPMLVVFRGNVDGAARSGLLLVLISWALAMTLFRSPVMSLLGRYAVGSQMPLAASILTLVGAVTGAIAPSVQPLFSRMGAPFAFATGSFILLLAAFVLRRVSPPPTPSDPSNATSAPRLVWPKLILIFGSGVGIAVGFRLLLRVLPLRALTEAGTPSSSQLTVLFVAIAISAIPTGGLAVRLGNTRAMLIGLAMLAGGLGLGLLSQAPAFITVLTVLMGCAFSLVSNGTLPFALALVPPAKGGLGTGLFFGGGTLGSALFISLFQNLAIASSIGLGAIAFLFTAACVAFADR